jgi:Secretion system C-terminal sorting domain/GEVED domain
VYELGSATSSPVTGSFNIPLTALTTPSPTRMRVIMKADVETTPCGTWGYGEVEDYTVNLIHNCAAPKYMATSSSLRDQMVIVYWPAVPSAASYVFAYRPYTTAGTDWTTVTITTNSYGIPFTANAMDYECKVKALCNGGTSEGIYSEEIVASTDPACSDAYEPNNYNTSAKPLSANTEIHALICPGDMDFYEVTTTQAEPKLMVIVNGLSRDYQLEGQYGEVTARSNNSQPIPDSIVFNATNAGTYMVSVVSLTGAYSNNSYTLHTSTRGMDWPMPLSQSGGLRAKAVVESTVIGADAMQVWPNPASRNVSVRYLSVSGGAGLLTVMDLSGRTVSSRPVSLDSGSNTLELDVSGLSDGLYIVRVQTDGHAHSAKVQVMK